MRILLGTERTGQYSVQYENCTSVFLCQYFYINVFNQLQYLLLYCIDLSRFCIVNDFICIIYFLFLQFYFVLLYVLFAFLMIFPTSRSLGNVGRQRKAGKYDTCLDKFWTYFYVL